MSLLNENEAALFILKGSFSFGLVLHILSILIRIYWIIYGPTLLLAVLPYTAMEVLFIYYSSMTIYIKSSNKVKSWVKIFSMISVLSCFSLIAICLSLDLILGNNLEDMDVSSLRSLLKLLCIILWAGPLISNVTFIGICWITKKTPPSISLQTYQEAPMYDWKHSKHSASELFSESTEYETNISSINSFA